MPRVLIADDDTAFLAVAGKLLVESGFEVTVTTSGADALCILKAKPHPDVLVLDMVMPNMNGHEVLKALGPSAPPVVLITGEHVREEDFQGGKIARVLPKPFGARALLKAIYDAMGVMPPPGQAPEAVVGGPPCAPETTIEGGPLRMTPDQWERSVQRIKRVNGGAHG